VTAWAIQTYPAQNTNLNYNSAVIHRISASDYPSFPRYYDGYFTEVNFVNALQLTPSSFGSTNALTGVWQPARYTGTYGTNGFFLEFKDNSSLTTSSNVGLGKDTSGNGNYWTTNNISITAGVTYDSMTDVPTLTSATASNFAVLNPLKINATNPPTITNGNLQTLTAATNFGITFGTIGVSTGKFYWEITPTSLTGGGSIGVANDSAALDQFLGQNANGWSYYNDGNKYNNNTATAYGASYVANDVIGVALDMSAGTLVFYKNNSSQGTAFTGLTGTLFPAMSDGSGSGSSTFAANFGQRPFSYTPPTGFVALNTFNLPDSTIKKGNTVMDATLYTGTGASLSVTNAASFKPDLVWVKGRSGATDHALYDSVRGTTKQLESNSTGAETTEATGLTAFGSAGFTVGALAQMNTSAATYVGWQWQAGQGSSSSNTNGTITSTVSVNASAGFSIATFTTPSGYSNGTVGHGLGVAPALVIVKNRTGSPINWNTYHQSVGNGSALYLSGTNAAVVSSSFWNSTSPTSSVFSIGSNLYASANMVAYCWTPIAGYSAFGSYTGNDSNDGPFVYLGFRPKFVMFKASSTTSAWIILDSVRDSYNVEQYGLAPNNSNAESTYSGIPQVDFLSNGFKIRANNANIYWNNQSGSTIIYAAFAESPFRNSLAR
jgi:hypothetical protein